MFLYVADSGFWNYRYLYDPHVTPDNINETVSLYLQIGPNSSIVLHVMTMGIIKAKYSVLQEHL